MKVTVRADASTVIGTGHIQRCSTLCDLLRKRGAEIHFICRDHPGHLADLLRQRGFRVTVLPTAAGMDLGEIRRASYDDWLGSDWETDARQTAQAIGEDVVDWIIVDHYGIDARWEKHLRSKTGRILVVDDLADRLHDCDALLDQNLGRTTEDYAKCVSSSCTLLIGPEFALLRPEFAHARSRSLANPEAGGVRRILVSLGSNDSEDMTSRVLRELAGLGRTTSVKITVVLGSGAPHLANVRRVAASLDLDSRILTDVADMAELMAACDLAIGAAGSSAWERCCLGLPSVLIVLADNQRAGAAALVTAGAAVLVDMSDSGSLMSAVRSSFELEWHVRASHCCRAIVDGQGAMRVVRAILAMALGAEEVRPIRLGDLEMVRGWRNHPDVRKWMLTQHEISSEEHLDWFSRLSQDATRRALIFEADGVPTGFVNFSNTRRGATADWGFYTAPGSPKGMGLRLGRAALEYAFGALGLETVCGQVMVENESSIRFHERLGFKRESNLTARLTRATRNDEMVRLSLESAEWSQGPTLP